MVIDNKKFQTYNSLNGCLLNINSILMNSDFFNADNYFNSQFFDIFSRKNNLLFDQNYQMFNLEGNNIIINFNIISTLFRFMLSTLVQSIFSNSFNNLDFTPNIFSDNKFKIKQYSHYYSSILYYYNQLNFFCLNDRKISLNNFWTN